MITIEDIETHIKVEKELSVIVEKWANKNLEDWQSYCGYHLLSANRIGVEYLYEDFYSNTETYTEHDTIYVPIEEILKN